MQKSNEQLAKESISRYFHDCEYQFLVQSSKVKLKKGTNDILINGGHTKITATKTVKTVISDRKRCKSCNAISNFACVVRNVDTGKLNVIFFIKDGNGDFQPLTKDHILAKARGGTDAFSNLQSLCVKCNSDKADKVVYDIKHINHDKDIMVSREQYDSLVEKQKDFAYTRKRIKRIINKMPWWMKWLGIDKRIEKELKEPLMNKGYYDGFNTDN